VRDGIRIFDPMKDITFDEETVEQVKGVKPNQIIDWLGSWAIRPTTFPASPASASRRR